MLCDNSVCIAAQHETSFFLLVLRVDADGVKECIRDKLVVQQD